MIEQSDVAGEVLKIFFEEGGTVFATPRFSQNTVIYILVKLASEQAIYCQV